MQGVSSKKLLPMLIQAYSSKCESAVSMKAGSPTTGAEFPLYVLMMASIGCNKVIDKFTEVLSKFMAVLSKGRKARE
jgi:hypothetical protein